MRQSTAPERCHIDASCSFVVHSVAQLMASASQHNKNMLLLGGDIMRLVDHIRQINYRIIPLNPTNPEHYSLIRQAFMRRQALRRNLAGCRQLWAAYCNHSVVDDDTPIKVDTT